MVSTKPPSNAKNTASSPEVWNPPIQDLLEHIIKDVKTDFDGEEANPELMRLQTIWWNMPEKKVSQKDIREQADTMLGLPFIAENRGFTTGAYEAVRDEVMAIATHDYYFPVAHGIHAAYKDWTIDDFKELFRMLIEGGKEQTMPDLETLRKDNEDKLHSEDFDLEEDAGILTHKEPAPDFLNDRIPKLAKQLLNNPSLWPEFLNRLGWDVNTDHTELRLRLAEAVKEEARRENIHKTRKAIKKTAKEDWKFF